MLVLVCRHRSHELSCEHGMKLTSDTDMGISFFREQHTLKYGDVHEKFNFLKIQDLRPLSTCQKHFEMILLISSRWVWNLRKLQYSGISFFWKRNGHRLFTIRTWPKIWLSLICTNETLIVEKLWRHAQLAWYNYR